jgi:hypothetical protein
VGAPLGRRAPCGLAVRRRTGRAAGSYRSTRGHAPASRQTYRVATAACRATMNGVLRFLATLMLGTAVLVPGVLVLKALDIAGLAHFGLVLVAMLVGSLADRERFYGRSPPAID